MDRARALSRTRRQLGGRLTFRAPVILLRSNEVRVRVRGLRLRVGGGGGRVQNHTVSPLQLWFVSGGHTAATVRDEDAARPAARRRHRVLLVTSEQSPEGAGQKT